MSIGASLLLIAVGAILKWAVHVDSNNFNVNTIGVILMIVGAVGLVLSLVLMMTRRRTDIVTRPGRTTYIEPNDPMDPRL